MSNLTKYYLTNQNRTALIADLKELGLVKTDIDTQEDCATCGSLSVFNRYTKGEYDHETGDVITASEFIEAAANFKLREPLDVDTSAALPNGSKFIAPCSPDRVWAK